MQKIVPTIWCSGTANQAAKFYQSAVPTTEVVKTVTHPTESVLDFAQPLVGQNVTSEIAIDGFHMVFVNASSEFVPNPAINFLLNFSPQLCGGADSADQALRTTWDALADEGSVLMDLKRYPHSQLYGWVEDKYGVNWQLTLTHPEAAPRPFVMPQFMFCGAAQSDAEEATDHYVQAIPGSKPGQRVRYSDMGQPTPNGAEVVFSEFQLAGQWFTAMDSAVDQNFTFTEGVSLTIMAEGQEERDHILSALSADPEAERGGWFKDHWGVTWHVVALKT